jgi:hypothetical protein
VNTLTPVLLNMKNNNSEDQEQLRQKEIQIKEQNLRI